MQSLAYRMIYLTAARPRAFILVGMFTLLWLLTIGIYFTSPLTVQDPMYLLGEALPGFAALIGLLYYRPQRKLPWLLLIAATAFACAGDGIWWGYDRVDPNNVPYPSAADGLYLTRYALVFCMFAVLIWDRIRTLIVDRLLEAAIIVVSIVGFSWEYLIEPMANDVGASLLTRLISTAYPTMDLVIIAALVPLFVISGRRTVSLALLAVGMLVNVAADAVFMFTTIHGTYATGHWLDAGWFVGFALFVAAALHPSMRHVGVVEFRNESGPNLIRTLLLIVASMAPIVVILVSTIAHESVDVPVLTGISGIIFVLSILRLTRMSKQLERHVATVHEQNAELGRAHGDLFAAQVQRERILHRTVQTCETDRMRIAGDLHDGPIQMLTALSFETDRMLDPACVEDPESRTQVATAIQHRVQSVIGELRAVMSGLRPPALEERGLEAAIRDLVSGFCRRNPEVDLDATFALTPGRRYHRDHEVMMYRLVQEGLANVDKHAHAKHVQIELVETPTSIRIVLSDDGHGFDQIHIPDSVTSGHLGMALIQERVHMLNGSCSVESIPGTGTRIEIEIPLPELAQGDAR